MPEKEIVCCYIQKHYIVFPFSFLKTSISASENVLSFDRFIAARIKHSINRVGNIFIVCLL